MKGYRIETQHSMEYYTQYLPH